MKEKKRSCTDIVLMDFGLATEHNEKNGAAPFSEGVGTTCCVAPEAFEWSHNSSCNIWAIGVIMHVRFMGKPPFVGMNDAQMCKLIQSLDVQMWN